MSYKPCLMSMIYALLSCLLAGLLSGCDLNGPVPDYEPEELPASEDFDAHTGTWNSNGSKILFRHSDLSDPENLRSKMLWVVEMDTGERYPVFGGPALNPDWCPDDEEILFHSNTAPSSIYKYNIPEDSLMRLTGNESPNDPQKFRHTNIARWSPNGEQVLFTSSSRQSEGHGLVIMNPDGTDAELIISIGVGGRWFPEGERIVYVDWDDEQPGDRSRQLYTARADGSDQQKITDLENSDLIAHPNVSPDGGTIAFTHRSGPANNDIFLLDLECGEKKQLTYTNHEIRRPVWHPDGDRILFSARKREHDPPSLPDVESRLYIVDVENGDIEPVFPEP